MLKIIGAVMTAVSISGFFASAAAKLKKTERRQYAMLCSARYISESIRYEHLELFSIYSALNGREEDAVLSVFGRLSELKNNYGRGEIEKILTNSPLSTEEAEIFAEFLSGLGQTDIEGQLSRCENYKRIFLERHKKAENEYREKRSLYLKLGAYSALAAFVFLV